MQYGQNFLIVIRFLGTNYHGWQIQNNVLTVQEVFQNSLFNIFRIKTDIKGCSRTDAGVHANSYCISLNMNVKIEPRNLILAMNSVLPNDIRVINCIRVSKDFHARYSCIAKEYIYKIYNHEIMDPFMVGRSLHFRYHLDLNRVNNLCKSFVGYRDFSAFCSKDRRKKQNMFRNVMNFEASEHENIVEFKVKSDGFLYNMVRIMVGTVLEGNYKKMECSDIWKIFDSKDRNLAGPTLPPYGLYLNRVFYEELTI